MQAQGKLLAARKELLVCARVVCPAVVKQDCDGMLATLETQIPSLVVAVRDTRGQDVVGATLRLDGNPIDTSNGRALAVDPGTHVVEVQAKDMKPQKQQLVVYQGERARPVVLTLEPERAATPPPKRAEPPPVSPFVYVLGTLAGVALASFVTLEIKAVSDSTHMRHTCAPRCPQSDVDDVSTETVGANVSVVLAALFGAGTAAVWFAGRSAPAPQASSGAIPGLVLRF